jgi:hypothetical protein
MIDRRMGCIGLKGTLAGFRLGAKGYELVHQFMVLVIRISSSNSPRSCLIILPSNWSSIINFALYFIR